AVAQSSRISTIAGPPLPADGAPAAIQTIGFPTSVIADAAGGFYVVSPDQSRVYRVGADGVLNIIAGSSNGFSGDGGPAAAAQLSYPNGAAIDAQGGLYIADAGNGRIRKVANGVISTIAGNGNFGFSGDGGPATSAQLSYPYGVAVDADGNVYI